MIPKPKNEEKLKTPKWVIVEFKKLKNFDFELWVTWMVILGFKDATRVRISRSAPMAKHFE